jgi:hypothetical protein
MISHHPGFSVAKVKFGCVSREAAFLELGVIVDWLDRCKLPVSLLGNKYVFLILLMRSVHTRRGGPFVGKIADRWHERLRARRTRKHAVVWRLADLLLGQPLTGIDAVLEDVATLQNYGDASRK